LSYRRRQEALDSTLESGLQRGTFKMNERAVAQPQKIVGSTNTPARSHLLQRKCACGDRPGLDGGCTECRKKRLSRQHRPSTDHDGPSTVPPIVSEVLRSPGRPLDAGTRALMEACFGHDFGKVRVHTDARAAESARAVDARAYTVGTNVAFDEGQYQPTTEAGQRLLAHELTHVVQERHVPDVVAGASLTVGAPGEWAEREADRVADVFDSRGAAPPPIAPLHDKPASTLTPTLRRQPAPDCGPGTTRVRADTVGSVSIRCLPLQNGAIRAEYDSVFRKEPTHKEDKDQGDKEATYIPIKQPLLVYPPARLDAPYVDVFVFFHGHRTDYSVGKSTSGHENVALESHLAEAVAGTDRVGIAPQAPNTWNWSNGWNKWVSTWNWNEALSKVNHFDGLIQKGLEVLQKALRLDAPLEPRTIHVAGHSGGGIGIGQATEIKGGAKLYGDKVQDVTLQDAGYGFPWTSLLNWFLHGSPGKTVRILVSHSEGHLKSAPGDTRNVLASTFNVKTINETIARNKESDTLEAAEVPVTDPKDQKPGQGGFTLESQLVVKNKKTGDVQGTMVVFFAPGGGHYETAYASMGAAAAAGPQMTTGFLGEAKPGQYRVISRWGTKVYTDPDHSKETGKALPLDTLVTVTEVKLGTYTYEYQVGKKKVSDKITTGHAKIKDDKGNDLGWTPLSSLAPTTQPLKIQPKRVSASSQPNQASDVRTQTAASGLSGAGTRLPYLEQIRCAFGPRHDLSRVRAHLDERAAAASRSMGAAAYTAGESVAFDGWPDLHTAVHEAAHVVQQRRGVSLPGGVGRARDPHEQHADAVADAVVAGRSAALLLDGPSVVSGITGAALQRKDAPLPKGAIPSSELDPMETTAETAFMAKVYDAQQQWAIKNKTFTAGLPDSDLDEIEDKIKMHKSAVPDAKALLQQARADLAAQQTAGDEHALKVKKIGIDNAYRGMGSEKGAWQKSFRKHYKLTRDERAALDGGEFGDAAVQLLATQMRGFKAIPGFSNHSKGLAIDFMTTEKGLGSLGPDSGQRESWRKSWFWAWLNDHASTYSFSPLSTEEWHWDHS
jgi:hypothetical protein